MASSSSSSIVERQYNYGGLIVRTFVQSAKPSPPPALGAEDSQSTPLGGSLTNNQASSPVKRGRGRPRKNPKPSSMPDDNDDAGSDQSSQPGSLSQQKPPKKKRRHVAVGVLSGNSKVPDYISLLTEEEMTAVRKRNRRGKQWIPGEKTVMNELARLGRGLPDSTGTHQSQEEGEDNGEEEEEPGAELGLSEEIETADDVIDCDPFSVIDDIRLDTTDTTGAAGGMGSEPATDWMRTNEQTQFQQQTGGNGEGPYDYYICPPTNASTLEPPSAVLDKDSSFAEQLSSAAPELSAPILQPPNSATTPSHLTPPSSLSPQNPPPKRSSALPPLSLHVDSAAALGAKLTDLISASQTAFIPTPVHCSFTLPLPEGEFAQKQYATDLVSAISDVDRYVYVIRNSTWNSTSGGSRGAIFVCNMSLESLKKRRSGTGEDQKKVSMARTRYPCEGSITIRFLVKKNVINVLYKHHAIHRSPHDKIEDSDPVPESTTTKEAPPENFPTD